MIRFHDLRHSTATLLLEQGVELVVVKELLGHAHIGVTATVYAHVRLRLQRQAIDLLGHTLGNLTDAGAEANDGDPPVWLASVRRRCRQLLPSDTPEAPPETNPVGSLGVNDNHAHLESGELRFSNTVQ